MSKRRFDLYYSVRVRVLAESVEEARKLADDVLDAVEEVESHDWDGDVDDEEDERREEETLRAARERAERVRTVPCEKCGFLYCWTEKPHFLCTACGKRPTTTDRARCRECEVVVLARKKEEGAS